MPNNEILLDEPALWLPSNLDVNGDPLPGEPQYTPRVDRRLIEALITDGVFDRLGGHMKVRQRAAGANMSVEIDPGFLGVTADGQAYAGRYLAVANAVQTLQIDDAPASGSRIDLIVVRVHDSSITGVRNEAVYEAVKGATDAGGNPSTPALPDSSLPLAEILVTATVAGQPRVSITDADITDRRAQARVPLGVTEAGPTDVYTAALPPVSWPDGVTTLAVATSEGWPVAGTLVTTKQATVADAGERAVQRLVSIYGDSFELVRQAGDPDGNGVWTWAAWSSAPSRPKQSYVATAVSKSTGGWSVGQGGAVKVVSLRTGAWGYAMVTNGARLQVDVNGDAYVGLEIYRDSDGVLVAATSSDESFGIDNSPSTTFQLRGSFVMRYDLAPFTDYSFYQQYYIVGGTTASFAHRRLIVQTY